MDICSFAFNIDLSKGKSIIGSKDVAGLKMPPPIPMVSICDLPQVRGGRVESNLNVSAI